MQAKQSHTAADVLYVSQHHEFIHAIFFRVGKSILSSLINNFNTPKTMIKKYYKFSGDKFKTTIKFKVETVMFTIKV